MLAALCLASVAGASEPTVILLSWDGTRWDYPDRVTLPTLERVAREGTRAERLIPVFPTSTFPNHVALATGAHTDRHGIVANVFDDPELGRFRYSDDARFIDAEPLWIAAERQGVKAACFFWVGSETDWRGQGATYRRKPFDDDVTESEKVDQILAWLDLPEAERPRLILSWWHGADGVGHRYGPDHPNITTALLEQDAQLARLLAGLDTRGAWPHTTLLIVSDHGMVAARGVVEVLPPLEARGIGARISRGGGFGFVALDDPARLHEALAVLAEVDGLSAYASADLPPTFRAHRPPRSGHITVVPEAPRVLYRARGWGTWLYVTFANLVGRQLGVHGYPPENPDTHAIFFAMGRGVRPDLTLGAVRAIDVAPTAAHLLGIEPPADAEGIPIEGIGP